MGMVDNNPNNPMTTEGVIAARTEGLEEAIEERRQEMEIDAMAEARGESGHHDGDGNAIGIAQRRAGVSVDPHPKWSRPILVPIPSGPDPFRSRSLTL